MAHADEKFAVNPYATHFDPSREPSDDSAGAGRGIQYLLAYKYIFRRPDWLTTVLLVCLCQIIPIVGPIVVLGYMYELIEALHRRPAAPYPPFDFNRFADYLMRGLWPFLVGLIVTLVLSPILLAAVYGPMILLFVLLGSGNESMAPLAMVILIPAWILLYLAALVLMTALPAPMMLRAGLAQDFAQWFDFAFLRGFLARVWREGLLAILFLVATGTLLMFAGLLACYVGMFPAMAVYLLAYAHLLYQLYALYLARGGPPIPLKDAPLEAALL